MSTFYEETVTCAACRQESKQTSIGSTNRFGSPDLDLRPPEMMRSTMCLWVQECPNCGYVAEDLGAELPRIGELLASEEYKTCDGHGLKSPLARRFYKQYLIAVAAANRDEAYRAALHAAWACDDASDTEGAILCRKHALERLRYKKMFGRVSENETVVRADLLRRTGQFDALIAEYEGKKYKNETIAAVIAFELRLAEAGDTACYTVADATADGE